MEINLYDMFHTNTLRDRQTALVVVNKVSIIPPSTSVTLNFKEIIFASRSFCHELLTNLKNRKNVHFENVNEEVMKMMTIALKKPNVNLNIPTKIAMIS